jgi:3-oxoacyl-[acyl-carrier-protein] synthase-3
MIAKIQGVRIAGVGSAVPEDVFTWEETAQAIGATKREGSKIAQMTGVQRRHVAPKGLCASDMAYFAADKLLSDLGWGRESVQALVLVTQTPDYGLPASSCTLQSRLGLSNDCAAFDVSLGCSGYIYGLWLCSNLIASGSVRRVLLLAGETSTWICSPQDRSTAFIFGDAGTATALERFEDAPPMDFVLGTDGTGRDFLIQPGGGYRNQITADSFERRPDATGKLRGPLDLYMDGAEVFRFTLERVPKLFQQLMASSGWSLDQIDAFVPHQANLYMLQVLSEQLNIPAEKLILSLQEFGNTSSASVPLAMTHRLADRLRQGAHRLVLAGFGVGWSWGAVAVTCGPIVMPDIVFIGREATPAAI